MKKILALLSVAAALSGCWEPGQGTFSSANAIVNGATNPTGPKAVQVVFSDNSANALSATNTSGVPASFNVPPSSGTPASAGQQAQILYNADGSFLANGTADVNWPGWITSVEVGVTGTNGQYSLPGSGTSYPSNPNCARFADTMNESNSQCIIGTIGAVLGTSVNCGAPEHMFRVSEADCNFGTDSEQKGAGLGNGSTNDTVYVRVNLNRSGLGPTENIMMVVTYAASYYYPADPNPSDCFTSYNPITGSGFTPGVTGQFSSGSTLTPEACSDFAWKTYMRHSKSEGPVQPFATMIPPSYSFVANNPNKTTGLTLSTKQFIYPIAGDQGLQVLQLSRNFSTLKNSDSNFMGACDPSNNRLNPTGANTPNCAGLVLYSITLFRI